jgi:excisionase family DNA binding protein
MRKDDAVEITQRLGGHRYHRRLSRGVVTVAQAAELLQVTPRTIWNLVRRGQLHPQRRGSRVCFLLSEIRFRAGVSRERR